MAVDTSTQIVRESPEIEARKLALMDEAKRLYETKLNLPAQEAAGLSATTLRASDLATQGVGAWQPYLDAGSQGITQGQNLVQQGADVATGINAAPGFATAQGTMGQASNLAGGIVGAGTPGQTAAMTSLGQGIQGYNAATGGYDTATTQRFMNPYQEMVTQNALKEMRRQGDIASQGTAAQAVRAGAFGGTREGVQRAEQERNLQDLMSQRIFQDLSANYGQAQTAGMTAYEQEQQRQLAAASGLTNAGIAQSNVGSALANIYTNAAGQTANIGQGIGSLTSQEANIDLNKANTLGTLGSNIGALGTQQAAIGEATQRAGMNDVNLLSGIGSIEQQNAQNQLDAIRNTKLQEAMAPYQQLGYMSDIYKGAPTSQMSMTSTSAPSPSTFQTVAGTVIGGVTTAAAANKAGLF
jgi:hypothetical protein